MYGQRRPLEECQPRGRSFVWFGKAKAVFFGQFINEASVNTSQGTHELLATAQTAQVFMSTHPQYPFSGLPAWEFQNILRSEQQRTRKRWLPHVGKTIADPLADLQSGLEALDAILPDVPAPLYHMLGVWWIRRRQFRRFQTGIQNGSFPGPPEGWSMPIEFLETTKGENHSRTASILIVATTRRDCGNRSFGSARGRDRNLGLH